MGKIILQCAISKDYFIARSNGDFDFLTMPEDKAFLDYFNHFLEGIDLIVMGYKTYQVMKDLGSMPFDEIPKLVFTKNHMDKADDEAVFTNQLISTFIKNNNKNIWLFGGAELFTAFLKLDAIDEVHLYQERVSIGEGIPLFYDKNWKTHFEEKECIHYSRGTLMKYKKR